ncbi:MAG: YggS family pyridoxal phosphate-dependent enzyme [Phycisphaerales bacterium]
MTTRQDVKSHLALRYELVKERVARAATRAGRDPSSVVIVAVSKYSGVDDIRELITLGHRDFGEGQVQQLTQRAAMIDEWYARQRRLPAATQAATAPRPEPAESAPVRWHMIGHLQRNKVKRAIEVSRLIHSVDSLRVAEEIQGHALRTDQVVDVLVQVNCSGENSKFGCAPAAARHLVDQINTMINVRVRGLMTMAAPDAQPEHARPCFGRLRDLYEEIIAQGFGLEHFNILSMGMSSDFEVAIEEGANLVRVGSAIFGEVRSPDAAPDDEP